MQLCLKNIYSVNQGAESRINQIQKKKQVLCLFFLFFSDKALCVHEQILDG